MASSNKKIDLKFDKTWLLNYYEFFCRVAKNVNSIFMSVVYLPFFKPFKQAVIVFLILISFLQFQIEERITLDHLNKMKQAFEVMTNNQNK